MDIKIVKTEHPKEKPDPKTLGFGKIFTDHMFVMDYSREEGWHDARIVPFGYLSIHPASTVLHYGSEIFEGLKAYRRADGKGSAFPPHRKRQKNEQFGRAPLPSLKFPRRTPLRLSPPL